MDHKRFRQKMKQDEFQSHGKGILHFTKITRLWRLPMPLCEENVGHLAHSPSGERQPCHFKLLLRNKMKDQSKTKQKPLSPGEKTACGLNPGDMKTRARTPALLGSASNPSLASVYRAYNSNAKALGPSKFLHGFSPGSK